MDPWIAKIVEQVRTTPPACLSGFIVSPTNPEEWNDRAAWRLACFCGGTVGNVLGHDLKTCDPEYDGPPCFVSPLGFACNTCGKVTEILDTGRHGYCSEISKGGEENFDCNIRGSGDRQAIPCPHCEASDFTVIASCGHSHFDLIEDEPELEPRAQEYFDTFACRGVCVTCREESILASFSLT